jgi:hypothetical protein
MKLVLISLFALVLSIPAFADQVIWSCSYNGNPNALTVTLIDPTTGSAGVFGSINDQGLVQALGFRYATQMYGIGSKMENLETSNLDMIYGENVSGFQFNHVNGGIDVVPGYTDHVSPDYHTNYTNHVFFAYGECTYYPINN